MLVNVLIKALIAPLVILGGANLNSPLYQIFKDDGRRIDPPVSIAFVRHVDRSETYSVKDLCSESWPKGVPMGWNLTFRLTNTQILALSQLLLSSRKKHNNVAHGSFYLQPLCSTTEFPPIINGRAIVGINETSNGEEYVVAYRDGGSDTVNTIVHLVRDDTTTSSDGVVVFRNLTLLKQVERAFLNGDAREAYAVHNNYGYEYYINELGVPIVPDVQEWEFEAMFCYHAGVQPFCLESQQRTVDGVPYEFCERCKPGLLGKNCQLDSNECMDNGTYQKVKVWHSECKDMKLASDVYRWSGIIHHGGHRCSENSTCVNTFGSYKCKCDAGWEGDFCFEDIDECSNTSNNNCTKETSECLNTIGSYECICRIGYAGKYCELNEICEVLMPCSNGSTCVKYGYDYVCVCPQGYVGRNCTEKGSANLCKSQPCKNNGTCLEKGDRYACLCSGPYTGENCADKLAFSLVIERRHIAYAAIGVVGLIFILIFASICLRTRGKMKETQMRGNYRKKENPDIAGTVE